jgi:glycosyltransferase involved in cell wall biosynthesis
MADTKTICVVTAVYNDWPAFSHLLSDFEKSFAGEKLLFDVVVVNDASTTSLQSRFEEHTGGQLIRSVTVLDLMANLGNQFAVAVGLRYATEHRPCDAVLVMDADGEDRLADAKRLIEAWQSKPDMIMVGRRAKRSESAAFKLFYSLYRATFRILTGSRIAFGNFSVIPQPLLRSVAYRPELPHHYSATILRTRLPMIEIATERGHRYAGRSHMNMPALVFHAVAGFSVFSDVLFSRLLIASASTAGLCGVGIIFVTALRLFTDVAFPNWATTVIAFLALLASQAILLILCSGFLLLMGRSSMLLTSLETSKMVVRVTTFGAVADTAAKQAHS